MAEDVVDIAIKQSGLPQSSCVTNELKLYGHDKPVGPAEIVSLTNDELKALIKKSVAEEMCMTVEDFLSRRTRQLLLDANEAIKAAPLVAKLMAEEMKKDENWIKEQINIFNTVAKNYKPQTIN
jgi:glycerol-3-phosphate dehydrogenase